MSDTVQLTLVLRQPPGSQQIAESLLAGTYDPAQTKPADIAASPADVAAVVSFAESHRLEVVSVDPAARTVRVAGSIDDIEKAFGITAGGAAGLEYRGPMKLPGQLDEIVIAVLGLDRRPIARR